MPLTVWSEPQDAGSGVDAPEPMERLLLSVSSEYDFDTTVARVRESISNNNFQYLKESAFQDGERESRTLYFCNFDMLKRSVMQDDRVGVGLPCTITVIRGSGGVRIQTMNPVLVAQMAGVETPELCLDLRGMLEDVLDEAVM
ncbi:MAG: DUF302 domain-containing protein [Gammaproteobacteria bacterium]